MMRHILLCIIIGLSIRALSLFLNLSHYYEEGDGSQRDSKHNSKHTMNFHHEEEQKIENRTIWINAIQKMYNGGHLNRDYAKYILIQGRDLMEKLPSFYDVSLPPIHDFEGHEKASKKRITVRSSHLK